MNADETRSLAARRHDIAQASRAFAAARGELNAILARKRELTRSVGLAKGRLDRKKDVERFIEELQADAHAKRVGDFERLLSALVAEVLPGEKPVSLELEIERGQPSLDIVSRVGADLSEDIFEDQGGALTNIIVLGLRMIAVVRSGMRRFIVLDEPDCWVKTDRIPAFYSVVKEAARKIGLQCFVISHHETSQFSDGISVARLDGHPEQPEGARVENSPRPHRWSEEEEGFRYIRLINFQGYVDETLRLTPGVNALIGDNNTGKSSFVRAFRAVFYGDVRDSLIRRGQKQCSVEIGLPGGRVLEWSRQLRKSANWRLLGPDGTPVSDEFDTNSRTVPDWVRKHIGIGPINGLDPHIVKQKLPVFLLDKPGSTRASVLAIGQEASHIRDMVKTYKKMCERDAAHVKEGEMEMSRLLGREQRLSAALEREALLDDLGRLVDGCEAREAEAARLKGVLDRIDRLERDAKRAKRVLEVLAALPAPDDAADVESALRSAISIATTLRRIDAAEAERLRNEARIEALGKLPSPPEIVSSSEAIRIGKSVRDQELALARIRKSAEALARLPLEIPAVKDNRETARMISRVERAERNLDGLRGSLAEAQAGLDEVEARVQRALEATGNSCPLCGGPVEDAAAFLGHGAHGEHAHG